MIIVPRKTLYLPSRLWSGDKARQRGSIMMAAAGVAGIAGGAVWSLSNLAASYLDVGGATTTYAVNMIFRLDGTVDVVKDIGADLNDEETYVEPATQSDITWIRVTNQSGNDMTAGDARGVWLQLNVQRNFVMRYTSSGGDDQISGTFDFELSSDASGAPIEAQALGLTVNVGELF